MDLLEGLRVFVATAETGSFTAAGERLGISNRLTSKYLAELEERLGTRLLQRTTRRIGLTPAGADLLARAPALLDELDDMLAGARAQSRGFSGMLRISAPVNFGALHVKDLLARFAESHPDLSIDLRLDDSYVDLAAQGIDLAFRIGTPDRQSLKVRRLGAIGTVPVASPAYLARHGTPLRPEDLAHHDCILDTNRRNAQRWLFLKDGIETAATVSGRFMVNSAQVARDLAETGLGIALCPSFVLRETLSAGRLVALLPEFATPELPVNAVYLEGRSLPRKVRALIDFAAETFRTGFHA